MNKPIDIFYKDDSLAELAAEKLTGQKPITLRGRAPAFTACKGLVTKTKDDGYFIDIDPALDPLEQFKVFLHEVAHIKLHQFTDELSQEPALPPGSVTLTVDQMESLDPVDSSDESEADEWAAKWMQFADQWHHFYPGGELVSRLRVLLEDWTDKEYTDELTELYFRVKELRK